MFWFTGKSLENLRVGCGFPNTELPELSLIFHQKTPKNNRFQKQSNWSLLKLFAMWPLLWLSSPARSQSDCRVMVTFNHVCPNEFLALILLTIEGWKAESTISHIVVLESIHLVVRSCLQISLLKLSEYKRIIFYSPPLPPPMKKYLKNSNNNVENQKRKRKTEIRKRTFVKKSSKVSETLQQSKLSMNKKKPSIIKDIITLKLSGTSINVNLGHSAWIYLTLINLAGKFP